MPQQRSNNWKVTLSAEGLLFANGCISQNIHIFTMTTTTITSLNHWQTIMMFDILSRPVACQWAPWPLALTSQSSCFMDTVTGKQKTSIIHLTATTTSVKICCFLLVVLVSPTSCPLSPHSPTLPFPSLSLRAPCFYLFSLPILPCSFQRSSSSPSYLVLLVSRSSQIHLLLIITLFTVVLLLLE